MNKSKLILAVVAASTLILSGCGGGGGSTAPAAPTTPPTSTATSTINSVVSTPSYPTASNQAVVYSMLNADRVSCGFGSVSQSTQLDQAALAHSRWMLLNNMTGHYESTTYPNGFTGVNPQDRGVAAGYVYSTNAGLESGEGQADVSGQVAYSPISMLTELLASPYHEVDLMRGWINIGIGYMDSNAAGTTATYGARTVMNVDEGVPSGATYQVPGPDDVLTYPCQGTTGTATELANQESPSPVPGRNFVTSPIGQPIVVELAFGNTLTLTSATMVDMANGSTVALLAPVDSANDPNPGYIESNEGYIMPNAPLAANTSYQVTLNGTNNGTAFSRTFSFTTGS
ncbi:MAG: CAP domain-containing protein [Burkholderiaceae bacterium]|nr:MAG: CAP domain-containing protein [Burkholderiaceae bacterium]